MRKWKLSKLHKVLFAIFSNLLIYGLIEGEFQEAMNAGAKLCLSCIGLYNMIF